MVRTDDLVIHGRLPLWQRHGRAAVASIATPAGRCQRAFDQLWRGELIGPRGRRSCSRAGGTATIERLPFQRMERISQALALGRIENIFVPSLQIASARRPEVRPGREMDRYQAANVSYRKVWTADKLIVGHASVEPCKEMLQPKMPSLRERRKISSRDTGPGKALPFNPGAAFRKASWAA